MMKLKPLNIGTTPNGEAFTLPPEAVTQTFAILAKRGSGKTYTAAVLVEELLKARLSVCVVDPVGVWWGLRADAGGTGPGLPIVVLGGDHGDLPLAATAGELAATLVVEEAVSMVLDLSHLRKGEQRRFMTDFAEQLYHKNRQPLHLVLDEADTFAPQRPRRGQDRLLGAIEDVVRRGRARGLGIILVTQRAAILSKDILTQAEVLVALRTIAPQDRDAIDAWMRIHGDPEQREALMQSLPSLPVGGAWFWSPGWLDVFAQVQVRRRETFDSSATPQIGVEVQAPKQLADVDMAALRERLVVAVDEAQTDDPRHLQARIADLERQLKARPVETKIETVIERVEVPVLPADQIDRIEQAAQQLAGLGAQLTETAQALEVALTRAKQPATASNHTDRSTRRPPRSTGPTTEHSVVEPGQPPSQDPLCLRAGERRMLEALAQRYPDPVTRPQLATLARLTRRGGTFSTYLSTLRRSDLIEEQGNHIQVSPAGLNHLGYTTPPPPQTTEEILAMWHGALRAGERKMLDELVDVYPDSLSRAELAERTAYEVTGGTFSTYLSTLRRNGLADVDGDQVQASATLFLGNR